MTDRDDELAAALRDYYQRDGAGAVPRPQPEGRDVCRPTRSPRPSMGRHRWRRVRRRGGGHGRRGRAGQPQPAHVGGTWPLHADTRCQRVGDALASASALPRQQQRLCPPGRTAGRPGATGLHGLVGDIRLAQPGLGARHGLLFDTPVHIGAPHAGRRRNLARGACAADPWPVGATGGIIRFADAANGWVAVGSHFLATHDGGATWHGVSFPGVPGASVADVETAGGLAYAWVDQSNQGSGAAGLYAAGIEDDSWNFVNSVPPGSGGEGRISLAGGHAWLVVGATRAYTQTDLTTWHALPSPCSAGAQLALAPANVNTVYASCTSNGSAGGSRVSAHRVRVAGWRADIPSRQRTAADRRPRRYLGNP